MSEETLHFAPILHTQRLTLTLVDFDNKADEEVFTAMLGAAAGEILKLPGPEARKNAEQSVDFYRSYGRIQPELLGGRRANKAAIWLVRLGANSPQGKCIGAAYVVQRSLIPDQAWVLLPEYRSMGYATESSKEVLRYLRDELGLKDMMAIVHPSSPKSPSVAKRVGYVLVEGGVQFEDGVTTLLLYALPTARALPKDLVFQRFARLE